MRDIFRDKRRKDKIDQNQLIEQLHQQIGQQKVELDWLKKNLHCSVEKKCSCIVSEDVNLSVVKKCNTLNLARSIAQWKATARLADRFFVILTN